MYSKISTLLSIRLFYTISEVTSQFTAQPLSIIDLSYSYNNDTPTFPTQKPFELENTFRGYRDNDTWFETNNLCSSEHSGTHIDAPRHFTKGGRTTDKIPLEKLYRVPGVKIDVRSKVSATRENFGILVADLEEFVQLEGPIPDGAVVLFQTGRGEIVEDFSAYIGLDENNQTNYPALTRESAQWIVDYKLQNNLSKGIIGVGLDSLSLDGGQSKERAAHKVILNNDLYGIENVANIHKLPSKGFTLTIMPIKIEGGSGGPTRVLAEIV